jgi:ferrochelatase
VQGFQSRFGKEEWLQPYTDQVLDGLPAQGVKTVLATCPGFTADCLETLDEIGNEGGEAFRRAGGERLTLAPCLNDHPRWLDAMAQIVRAEAAGWVPQEETTR